MAKCVRCGRGGMGLLHSAIKLNDGNFVCFSCFKELGYEPKEYITIAPYSLSWDSIKNGKDYYDFKRYEEFYKADAAKYGISVKHYKQLDNAGATDNEIKMFKTMCAILEDEELNTDALDVELADKDALNVFLDGVLIIQYKSEPDVKWIIFPHESYDKIRIGGVAKLRSSLAQKIIEAYKSAI